MKNCYVVATAPLAMNGCLAPRIATQPQATLVNEGDTIELSVLASGSAPLSYQWYKDDVLLAGETADTITITPAYTYDAGDYRAAVVNNCGTVLSNTALVWVIGAGAGSGTNIIQFTVGDPSYPQGGDNTLTDGGFADNDIAYFRNYAIQGQVNTGESYYTKPASGAGSDTMTVYPAWQTGELITIIY